MAVFVDLEEEDIEQPQDGQLLLDAVKVAAVTEATASNGTGKHREEAHELTVTDDPNRNSMTQALGCYPIVMSVAANIDLNTLDSLSRTCRRIHEGVLQYRKMLLVSTLHCVNEPLPVDPEETLRFRARAGNWFYMEDTAGRTGYNGKSGQCARDLVSDCRRCGIVVCRNCAIKPPAPIVLRDRHRRLCVACTEAPLGYLLKPRLASEVTLACDNLERATCRCASDGVWLCQPCGRSIRSDDNEYKRQLDPVSLIFPSPQLTQSSSIWKWRNQYTDVLGGLGTGIGDGDRGVICGRGGECRAFREREQETDCDAADARDADSYYSGTTPLRHTNSSSSLSPWSSGSSGLGGSGGFGSDTADRRTPSPQLKAGYERHEIEGIGGVVKKKLVRMVKIGACVPEWEDERQRGEILGREVQGQRRSWCGWCWRVIPDRKDRDAAAAQVRIKQGDNKV